MSQITENIIIDAFSQDQYRFWLAFIELDDPLLVDVEIPAGAKHIRLMKADGLPLFQLFYRENLKMISPYEALEAICSGRVEFRNAQDQEYAEQLANACIPAYDRIIEQVSCVKRACIAVSAISVVTILLAVVVRLTSRRK